MGSARRKNAYLSEVNSDFAPMIPMINEAFKRIWTYHDMNDFRANWTTTRASYPECVPSEGFDIHYQMVPLSDGTKAEIRLYRPIDAESYVSLPLLFVLHGGGWVVGGHDTENGMCRSVCVKNKMAVLSVDYRKAPEHQFPTALNDGYDVFKWAIKNSSHLGFNHEKIILGGTSAGGNLVAALALKLRDEGALYGVIGQLLNVPATCHPKHFPHDKYELDSYVQNADSPTINGKQMVWFWKQYYPDAGLDPLASPLLANSHVGLPQALIQVAGMDSLRDEGLAYAEALSNAGVKTRLEVFPGLPHGFMLAIKMNFTTRYYQNMVDWVSKILENSGDNLAK